MFLVYDTDTMTESEIQVLIALRVQKELNKMDVVYLTFDDILNDINAYFDVNEMPRDKQGIYDFINDTVEGWLELNE